MQFRAEKLALEAQYMGEAELTTARSELVTAAQSLLVRARDWVDAR